MLTFRVLFSVLAVCMMLCIHAQPVLLTNAAVIDVKTGQLLEGRYILLDQGKIVEVGRMKALKKPAAAAEINVEGKYILPGMTDAHIHFFQSGGLYTRPDALDLTGKMPYHEERKEAFANTTDYFQRYLRLGITTIIDVGGPMHNFTIRDSVSKTTSSPNILVTGPLFSMVDNKPLEDTDAPIVQISDKEQADRLLAKILPYKPDFIKVWYIASPEMPAEKNFELVKYIGDKARANGLKLVVHATELNTATLAIDAGANVLVHSVTDTLVTDDFIAKLKKNKVAYIPTLIVENNYYTVFSTQLKNHKQDLAWANSFNYGSLTDLKAIPEKTLPPVVAYLKKNGLPSQLLKNEEIMRENLRRLYKAGALIVAGTDAGNIGTQHASSFIQELESMQKASISNVDLLRMATINPAIAFGKEGEWGSIEKNRKADLVVLEKNPLQDIAHLNSIDAIIKSGQYFKADTIVKESAEAVVQRQLNAYNARDIDAFLDTYTEDVELYMWQDPNPRKGKDLMRKDYEEMFKQVPDLYCEIISRIKLGNKIIDHEKVRFNGQYVQAIAIYEVENGKIKRVTFLE